MVGQNLKTIKKKKEKTSSDQLINITNLNFISEDPFETNLSDINFSVNRGECLGIAGISGNGQSELFQVLSGEIISDKNSIEFNKNFIGDATMAPYEITNAGGSIEHWNEEAGHVWIKRLSDHFENMAWLNPVPDDHWDYTSSICILKDLFDERIDRKSVV